MRSQEYFKDVPLSHVVYYVSVVSVTNKGAQEHLWVPDWEPDSVSRMSYLSVIGSLCIGFGCLTLRSA
jgi:hypothetical protein